MEEEHFRKKEQRTQTEDNRNKHGAAKEQKSSPQEQGIVNYERMAKKRETHRVRSGWSLKTIVGITETPEGAVRHCGLSS